MRFTDLVVTLIVATSTALLTNSITPADTTPTQLPTALPTYTPTERPTVAPTTRLPTAQPTLPPPTKCFETTNELLPLVDLLLQGGNASELEETYGLPMGTTWCGCSGIQDFSNLFHARDRNSAAASFNEDIIPFVECLFPW
jgi:hypothetical protein